MVKDESNPEEKPLISTNYLPPLTNTNIQGDQQQQPQQPQQPQQQQQPSSSVNPNPLDPAANPNPNPNPNAIPYSSTPYNGVPMPYNPNPNQIPYNTPPYNTQPYNTQPYNTPNQIPYNTPNQIPYNTPYPNQIAYHNHPNSQENNCYIHPETTARHTCQECQRKICDLCLNPKSCSNSQYVCPICYSKGRRHLLGCFVASVIFALFVFGLYIAFSGA